MYFILILSLSLTHKQESGRESAVSFTVDPVTQLLLCLTSTGFVYEISEKDGNSIIIII